MVGNNFSDISAVAKELVGELKEIDGLINVSSDVSDARDEVNIDIDPHAAAEFGLTAAEVGRQVNQFIVGAKVSEVDLEDITMDIVLRGQPEDADDMEELKNLDIEGPLGLVKLGSISDIGIEQGPVSISRFDLERSATISGDITAEDTTAIGALVAGQDRLPGPATGR